MFAPPMVGFLRWSGVAFSVYEVEVATAVASVVVAVIAVAGYLCNRGQIRLLSKAVDALVSLAKSQGKELGAMETLAGQSATRMGQAEAQ